MNSGYPTNGGTNNNGGEQRSTWGSILRLLYPGLGLKRWLLIGAVGIAVWSIGIAFLMRKLFEVRFPNFLPGNFEGVLLAVGGVIIVLLAVYGIYRSIGPLILASNDIPRIADTIYMRRSRGRGAKIVAIGGGTGLSVLLRGLKSYTDNLTAIITVADDGGSSGRLRRELGVPPPGDFRNCLVAMSDEESLLTELFQYRFDEGDGLKGHSFGNLFIAALSNVTNSFDRAIFESCRVLAVHGQIVPATVSNLNLSARLKDGVTVHGESSITEHGGEIDSLFIRPSDAKAYPLAVEAIQDAQLVVIGPGSLYTSILPNLLVPGITDAIRDASATKIYVCNVAMESGETKGYSVADHLEGLQRHTFEAVADYVLADSNSGVPTPVHAAELVVHDGRSLRHARLVEGDLSDPENPVRHEATKLARMVMEVYHESRKVKAPFRLTRR